MTLIKNIVVFVHIMNYNILRISFNMLFNIIILKEIVNSKNLFRIDILLEFLSPIVNIKSNSNIFMIYVAFLKNIVDSSTWLRGWISPILNAHLCSIILRYLNFHSTLNIMIKIINISLKCYLYLNIINNPFMYNVLFKYKIKEWLISQSHFVIKSRNYNYRVISHLLLLLL